MIGLVMTLAVEIIGGVQAQMKEEQHNEELVLQEYNAKKKTKSRFIKTSIIS